MKLIIMGAGYVGIALLRFLQNRAHELFITTTQKERIDTLKAYGKQVLVLNPDDNRELKDLIDACDGMVILVAPKNSENYENTYLKTAKNISSVLKERKTPFYLLYTSSTSVCEGLEHEWITEDMLLSPTSEHAKILLESEQQYLNSGANTCILRLGGIYGPKRELMDRAKRFSGVDMPGTGQEPTNHIHLDDIVAGINFCLECHLRGVYHLVNDDHMTRNKLYSTLCASVGIPCPKWNFERVDRKKGYKVSNQKIKESGFSFKHPLISIR